MKTNKNVLVPGYHGILTLLENNPSKILQIFIASHKENKRTETLLKLAQKNGIAVMKVKPQTLANKYPGHAQGVVAEIREEPRKDEKDLSQAIANTPSPMLFIALDGIQDPHNLGAIFRTAACAKASGIISPKDGAVGLTPVVSKVASGATALLPFYTVTNLVRSLEMVKEAGAFAIGAQLGAGRTLYEEDLSGNIVWVLGSEEKGLKSLTAKTCDSLVEIPQPGDIASLNVSVATGICLFETLRQRI